MMRLPQLFEKLPFFAWRAWAVFVGISPMLVGVKVGVGNGVLIKRNLPVGHIGDMVGCLHEEVDVVGNKDVRKVKAL